MVHVATVDSGNGAAIAAYRLHRGLQRLGIQSEMFVAQKRTDDPGVVLFKPAGDLVGRLRRRLRRMRIGRSLASYSEHRTPDLEVFSDDRTQYGGEVVAQLPPGDVTNLHAMLNFVDYGAFFTQTPPHARLVRTLHDMSFFTGGCHYTGDCGKYADRCGACPELGSDEERDPSRRSWQRKRAAFGGLRPGQLHIVATSTWMAGEARRSSLLKDFPISVIPCGLDTEAFSPRNRGWARDVLGIPQPARVVLFVAEPVSRRIKGFTLLARALEGLGDMTDLLLVSVGSGRLPVKVPVPHLHLGQIGHERLISLAYSAADVFVIPSLQEAFGQTALEATACGTPVVGFAVGGIVDTVRPGVTGLLVPPQDVSALGAAIRDLLDDPERRGEMAVNCRRLAVEEYALDIPARRYAALYRTMVADGEARPVPVDQSRHAFESRSIDGSG